VFDMKAAAANRREKLGGNNSEGAPWSMSS
jgi:hypothetical protein